jgi:uncharacterized protein (DUF302 family)
MEDTRYGLKVSLPVPYDDAIVRATDSLKAQGFGLLTTIDVKQTLKAKLDRDFRKYVILGACNPALADRALHAELAQVAREADRLLRQALASLESPVRTEVGSSSGRR